MKIITPFLCTAAVALTVFSAFIAEAASDSWYTPKSQNYNESTQHKNGGRIIIYKENQKREPCQGYLDLPMHYVDSCDREEPQMFVAEKPVVAAAPKPKPTPEAAILPIVSSYTILFDLNKSNLSSNENEKLNRAINEINKYNPNHVTVTGYTDSSGSRSYNQNLSKRREETVSAALLKRGITSYTLDRNTRGEDSQAVTTADGVRNQENRRVVIDFRR